MASSPHARGSSAAHPARPGPPDVVPARAGVIRMVMGRHRHRGRRPRTRGGHPGLAWALLPEKTSSPHARGSSVAPAGGCLLGQVVPARAGVIPCTSGPTQAARRRPRTRGGHPDTPARSASFLMSSPHARGSSAVKALTGVRSDVVPARAGVIRARRGNRGELWRRPRTRGGHPYRGSTWDRSAQSSPHARGSSVRHPVAVLPVQVVPARAGVIRYDPRPAPGRTGCPRTRGGHPGSSSLSAAKTTSSPHARGSSDRRHRLAPGAGVVPARAGVIRPRWGADPPPPRRPRTRGGHPASTAGSAITRVSSPHARGSSAVPDGPR